MTVFQSCTRKRLRIIESDDDEAEDELVIVKTDDSSAGIDGLSAGIDGLSAGIDGPPPYNRKRLRIIESDDDEAEDELVIVKTDDSPKRVKTEVRDTKVYEP